MDRPNPRNLTREQLASFIPRIDVQRAVEAFFRYLAESVPDAVDSNTELVETVQEAAGNAASIAGIAQAIASAALDLAQQANEAPPIVQMPAPDPDSSAHLISAMSAQIHALTQRVAALEERP